MYLGKELNTFALLYVKEACLSVLVLWDPFSPGTTISLPLDPHFSFTPSLEHASPEIIFHEYIHKYLSILR